ncbi:MAG: glycosyl hydrolase [Saprospiraceae bacterium]|nr:glycosyl hydrolase [Saprospiraceae bacterium]
MAPRTNFQISCQRLVLAMLCMAFFTPCLQAQEPFTASTFSGLKMRAIGPAFMSGRIADVVKNPKNPSTWYVATASGGVWKTTNNATTWQPIFDRYDSYTTGAIAIDPNNPNILWLGTGENASQRSAGYGDGVYKSLDAGRSWTNVGLKRSEHIGKILLDPRDPNTVYVAAQGPLWAPGGDRGLYKTVDGGKNWEQVLAISENTGVTDVVLDPRNPDVLYAASYQRRRHVGILVAGGPESAIFKSIDAGKSWKKLSKGLPGGDQGRIALAVSPQQPDVVYAHIAAEKGKSGFFRSSDQGESWKKKSDYIIVDPQYYGEIYPDPHQFDKVYVMDMMIHVTEDGGTNFERLNSRNKHVDNHALLFDPVDPDYLMVGSDGGLYESWDKGNSWKHIANLPLTQFYRVGIDNAEPFYHVYGGTQDNSTLGAPSRTNNIHGIRNSDWFITTGGDGFQTRVDPTDPNILYSQSQYAGIVRYDKRSGERQDIQPQAKPGEDALRWHWDSPLIISPHSSTRLYYAAQRLFRSDDRAESWTPISGDLSRNLDRNQMEVMGRVWGPEAVWKNVFTSPLSTIVSLAESRLSEGLLVVGTDDGLIQISEDGGGNWRKIDRFPGVPSGTYVSDVFLSPHDRNTVFAVFNNHKAGDFKPYALKSKDLGRSWTNIGQSLPDRHITWTIVEDHEQAGLLFLGTEFGLFFSVDEGSNWIQLKGGLPTVAIRDLEIQEREQDLVAASFGRGIFIFDDYSVLRQLGSGQLAEQAHLFAVKDARAYTPANPIGSTKGSLGDALFSAPNPPNGAIFTYHLKESLKSAKQQRRAAERKSLKETGNMKFPAWETLRAEDIAEDPFVLLTIRNSAGDVIRSLKGPSSAGFHRVNWDLRYPLSANSRRGGPMAMEGEYSVSLSIVEEGTFNQVGKPQRFQVKPLGLATLAASDPAAVQTYFKEAGALQSTLQASSRYLETQLENIATVKRQVLSTKAAATYLKSLRSIEIQLKDLALEFNGDQTRSSRAEFVQAGLLGRLRRAMRSQYNSSGPTKTHRENYEIAKAAYEGVHQKLKNIDRSLVDLQGTLRNEGIAWPATPALPDWSSQ